MISNSEPLVLLATELFPPDLCNALRRIAMTRPLDRRALIDFDDSFWGPSISRISDHRRGAPGTLGIPNHGVTRCELSDRDVFRPLHYCAVDLTSEDIEWRTRNLVAMSGAHLEQLVKRIGNLSFLPLGNALRKKIVRQQVDPSTWDQLWRYRSIYNDAKHRFDHDSGTHMFSIQDGVLSYAVARLLAQALYPLARLKTDWRFENDSTGGARVVHA